MNASVVQAQALAPTTTPSLSLIGVPNCGKTALFNRLTGSRQKVANYPGVTVERKEGRFVGPRSGRIFRLVDLPGAYSLEPTSLDEAIARDVVLGRHASEPPPDLLVCVVDATNLRLNLRLVLELKRIGRPMLVALNMSDVAKQRGYGSTGQRCSRRSAYPSLKPWQSAPAASASPGCNRRPRLL